MAKLVNVRRGYLVKTEAESSENVHEIIYRSANARNLAQRCASCIVGNCRIKRRHKTPHRPQTLIRVLVKCVCAPVHLGQCANCI